ncbi:hypothetical protein [Actinoplanes solisilvae]|uniref:hypothetical protein n=1 Tax=Actinoplanes solisilvae TaxID=2486853 RepID=UPI000FD741AB|nr:hypothetical protein [Actinoplanes solisilvae]
MRRTLASLALTGFLLAGGACAAQPGPSVAAVDALLVSADQQIGENTDPADLADDLRTDPPAKDVNAEGTTSQETAATAKRPAKSVAERVDRRLTALKRFDAAVDKAKHLQPAHRDTLKKLIADQTTGLTALRDKTGKDTARSIVVDYRVFVLTAPKVRLAAAIDTELAAVAKLRDRKNIDQAKLDAVEKSLTGQVDTLLALKPGPDAKALRASLEPIRTAAKEARTTLKSLR